MPRNLMLYTGIAALAFSLWSNVNLAESRALPPPLFDAPLTAETGHTATLTVAGGCFWGVEAVFEHVKGVKQAVSGYAGGDAATARYDQVSGGNTGHAEAVQVTYDPAQITPGQLLQIFFSVAHDPTQFNRQGPDHGPQYRSAIFASTPDQLKLAETYIAQLAEEGIFDAPIVTETTMLPHFYPAEEDHQDFMHKNPSHAYIVQHDRPKLRALQKEFPALYRP